MSKLQTHGERVIERTHLFSDSFGKRESAKVPFIIFNVMYLNAQGYFFFFFRHVMVFYKTFSSERHLLYICFPLYMDRIELVWFLV